MFNQCSHKSDNRLLGTSYKSAQRRKDNQVCRLLKSKTLKASIFKNSLKKVDDPLHLICSYNKTTVIISIQRNLLAFPPQFFEFSLKVIFVFSAPLCSQEQYLVRNSILPLQLSLMKKAKLADRIQIISLSK